MATHILWMPFFHIVRCINDIIQTILLRCGYWKQQPTPQHQVQVLDVKYRYKYDIVAQPANLADFILFPSSWEKIDYVLQPDLSLYCLTATHAVFVEGIKGGMTSGDSFMNSSQFLSARRVVTVPIDLFLKYADSLEPPQNKVVIIRNCGRCGSTLLCQMFDRTGFCVSLSEPPVLMSCRQLMDVFPEHLVKKLLQCSLKFLIQPFSGNKGNTAFIIKLKSHESHLLPSMSELLPNAVELFMYRDLIPTAFSYIKCYSALPIYAIHLWLALNVTILYKPIMKKMGFGAERFSLRLPSVFMVGFFETVLNCRTYLNTKSHHVGAVKYELLAAEPVPQMQKILVILGLPKEWAEDACKALETDSQKGTLLAGRGTQNRQLHAKEIELCNDICDTMDIPRFSESFVLEGTVL